MGFRCEQCGREHDGLPMDVGFEQPADYFSVPARQRKRRCEATPDWCVIDGRRFYVRGCLYVPVPEAGDEFAWGLWARVARRSFRRYVDFFGADGSREPPFRGRVSCEPHGYEGLDGHKLLVWLGPEGDRPTFTLEPSKHLLYREHKDGITLHRVQEILATMFPDQYA